jgi:hypothetical protein
MSRRGIRTGCFFHAGYRHVEWEGETPRSLRDGSLEVMAYTFASGPEPRLCRVQ